MIVDNTEAAKLLWEQLDREHDGNSIVKDELGAMEWGALRPAVRAMLCGVVRTFLERVSQSRRQPPVESLPPSKPQVQSKPRHQAKLPDFDALAVEAMARATQYATVPQWVAGTIADAYRLGREGRE